MRVRLRSRLRSCNEWTKINTYRASINCHCGVYFGRHMGMKFRLRNNTTSLHTNHTLQNGACMMVSYCVEHELITPSYSITHTKQYKRTICSSSPGPNDTRSIIHHSTNNEYRCRGGIITIVVYSESNTAAIWGRNYMIRSHRYYCIEHHLHLPPSHTQQHKRTRCLFRNNTTPVSYSQPTKINARPLLTLL